MSLFFGWVLVGILLFAMYRLPLSYIQLVLLSSVGLCVNILLSIADYEAYVVRHVFLSNLIFIAFIFLSKYQRVRPLALFSRANIAIRKLSFFSAIGFIFLLITYHYSVVGVPFFSANVDVERFQSASSGMMGIPSRFAGYAPALIFIYASVLYSSDILSGKVVAVILSICLTLLVFQGHKSSVAQIILVLIILAPFLNAKSISAYKYLISLLIIPGIYFIYLMFSKLTSVADMEFSVYILQRLSVISMAPVIGMYDPDFSPNYVGPFMFVNDLVYPFSMALGGSIETVNTQLSRHIYGVAPGNFSVPVTPGMIPYLFKEFGEFGSYFFIAALGVFASLVFYAAKGANTISKRVFIIWLQYVFYIGFTSGNLFYLLPNVLLVYFIFWFFERLFNAIFTEQSAR